jgi:hypothetical protein
MHLRIPHYENDVPAHQASPAHGNLSSILSYAALGDLRTIHLSKLINARCQQVVSAPKETIAH